MKKIKILVFPCGSEIGLEIYRSLKYSPHVELLGASSVNDHGRFVYENYIERVPFIEDDAIISFLAKLISEYKIDAIYPTMDKVIWKLKTNESALGCRVIASESSTTEVCLSKRKTYKLFKEVISVPKLYNAMDEITSFPVFIKPDIGYGSRDVTTANNVGELKLFFLTRTLTDYVVTEFLPGNEYTVDCFTDKHGKILFSGPRIRSRISNGISVHTRPVNGDKSEYETIAVIINKTLKLTGAWFFQVKRSNNDSLVLLEIASRLGGSSGLYRGLGVNFALLTIYDAFGFDVEIMQNEEVIEMDRALNNKYKLKIEYSKVYVDYDDCLIINNKVNIKLLGFLYSCLNKGKRIILITKHENNLIENLKGYRLNSLFDEIIHIDKTERKCKYIKGTDSIFIDDSFAERKNIKEYHNIPVFSPDMLDTIID